MKLLYSVLIISFLSACTQANQPNPNEILEEASLPSLDEECIFDLSTQTDEFLRSNHLLKNFTWDSKNKIAKGLIDSDSLQITRGGCSHFSFYCEITTKNIDSLKFTDHEFGFKKAMEIVKIVFPETDQDLFETLLKNHSYELQENKDVKSYLFTNQNYCNTSMYIRTLPSGFYKLEIGYYIC